MLEFLELSFSLTVLLSLPYLIVCLVCFVLLYQYSIWLLHFNKLLLSGSMSVLLDSDSETDSADFLADVVAVDVDAVPPVPGASL